MLNVYLSIKKSKYFACSTDYNIADVPIFYPDGSSTDSESPRKAIEKDVESKSPTDKDEQIAEEVAKRKKQEEEEREAQRRKTEDDERRRKAEEEEEKRRADEEAAERERIRIEENKKFEKQMEKELEQLYPQTSPKTIIVPTIVQPVRTTVSPKPTSICKLPVEPEVDVDFDAGYRFGNFY